jgi:thiol:disulfide interchange protein
MKKISVYLIIALLLGAVAHAQILDPVKWSFAVEKTSDSTANLLLKAKIDKTWHLYSQNIKPGGPLPTEFTFEKNPNYQKIGKVSEPRGIEDYDSIFSMPVTYFSNAATFVQKIKVLSDKKFTITGTLTFMCCDNTQCLPPKDVDFEFAIDGFKPGQAEEANGMGTEPTDSIAGEETDTLAAITADGDTQKTEGGGTLWWIFIAGLLAGLLGVITPCVYPMIPMTVTFFLRDNEKRAKAIKKALFFGLSIIFIYTFIGLIITAIFGPTALNDLSSSWLMNIIFFLLFLIFGLSFLGFFEIVMPSWLVNKSDKQVEKGGYFGTFFMALTLVIVSFSCTGPIVGTLLMEAATGQYTDPVIGMLGFSLAFALPFTLLAIFPSLLSKMPKSGGWMNTVKAFLGFLIIAFGMKFLSTADQVYHWGLLSRDMYLIIWIVIFTFAGLNLLGKIKLKHDSDLPFIGTFRLIFSIAVFTFVIYLFTGLFGAPLKSVSALLPPQTTSFFTGISASQTDAADAPELCGKPKYAEFLHFPHGLKGYFDYKEGLACAKNQKKPVLLDFNGHSCAKCKEMENKVWADERVLKKLKEDFIIISLLTDDRTKVAEAEWVTSALDGKIKKTIGAINADFQASAFKINAQPYYVIVDTEGNVLVPPMSYDLSVEKYLKFLDSGLEEFKKRNI